MDFKNLRNGIIKFWRYISIPKISSQEINPQKKIIKEGGLTLQYVSLLLRAWSTLQEKWSAFLVEH
jgi:hypothetical protein